MEKIGFKLNDQFDPENLDGFLLPAKRDNMKKDTHIPAEDDLVSATWIDYR